jgi:hypothetical protein
MRWTEFVFLRISGAFLLLRGVSFQSYIFLEERQEWIQWNLFLQSSDSGSRGRVGYGHNPNRKCEIKEYPQYGGLSCCRPYFFSKSRASTFLLPVVISALGADRVFGRDRVIEGHQTEHNAIRQDRSGVPLTENFYFSSK